MVGMAAVIRVLSLILPSLMGTLKSTRTKTRRPLTSMSFTESLFMSSSEKNGPGRAPGPDALRR